MTTKFNMKNPNQHREQVSKAERDGQAMGQRFGATKTIQFLQAFFKDTDLAQDMYDLYNFKRDPTDEQLTFEQFTLLLIDDMKLPFGQAISLSYALGYIDRARGLMPKDLATPKVKEEFRDQILDAKENPDDHEQLTLPGVLD